MRLVRFRSHGGCKRLGLRLGPRHVEERLLDMPEIEYLYVKTGDVRETPDQIGSLTLNLVEWDQRRSSDKILAEVRERTADLAGITIETRKPDPGPPIGKPIRNSREISAQRGQSQCLNSSKPR